MVLKNNVANVEQQTEFKILKFFIARSSSSLEHVILEGGLGTTCLSLEADVETSNLVGIVADYNSGRRRLVTWRGANRVRVFTKP